MATVSPSETTKGTRCLVKIVICIIVLGLCSTPFLIAFYSLTSTTSSIHSVFSCIPSSANLSGTTFKPPRSTMVKPNTTEHLQKLRAVMKNRNVVPETLNAYIVPTDDAHQNEYIAAPDRRREFISGFTGSAGTAVITEHHAALWTDGRYFLQAANQLDNNWVLMKDRLPDTPTFGQWLNQQLPQQSVVGADPTTLSETTWGALAKDLESQGNRLIQVNQNLVDFIWDSRPRLPNATVSVLSTHFTGSDWKEKIGQIRQKMEEKKADYLVITALDEIAWVLNLRGSDIPFNPVFFAYLIVGLNSVTLFLSENKTTSAVLDHLNLSGGDSMDTDMRIDLKPYTAIFQALERIADHESSKKIWIAPESSHAILSRIPITKLLRAASPVALMKSIKNPTELAGMWNAHVRDGVALAEFFCWMEKEVPRGNVTELTAAAKLEEIRSSQANYVSLSFDTISASGPNAAIIHYKPTPETDRSVTTCDLFLLDSGSQYLDGTTDVTRTVHFGSPTSYERECFTRVLQGNLALARAKFPNKTTGHRLDMAARQSLWNVGLDYAHGTGHGVGSFLNVHEGPMSISFRYNANDPGLMEGMVVTDEPGYYEADAFGIRIENQMVVEKVTAKYAKSNTFLGLRMLTLVPIQRKLLVLELLTKEEAEYIDHYHTMCLTHVGKALLELGKSDAYQWLVKETTSIE